MSGARRAAVDDPEVVGALEFKVLSSFDTFGVKMFPLASHRSKGIIHRSKMERTVWLCPACLSSFLPTNGTEFVREMETSLKSGKKSADI